jgi:hypothetical protein
LALLQWLLSQGAAAKLHRQLDVLMEVVGLLGLDQDTGHLEQARRRACAAGGLIMWQCGLLQRAS